MKHFFMLLLLATSLSISAQTKKIAFKSHSGSAENFAIALEDHLFDIDDSNFGQGIQPEVRNAQLDSVIFVSDSVSILVTSEYCNMRNRSKDNPMLWYAGRAITYNDPLFSKKHSLDSIRKIIKERYYFKNNIDKVIFIGYDNKRSCDSLPAEVNEPITFIKAKNKNSETGSQTIWIVAAIAGISLLAAMMNRKAVVS